MNSVRTAVIGPVPPYRAGIAYCTMRLAEELGADVISFRRQFPKSLYPGSSDLDPTLPRYDRARFLLDILNPLTWIHTGLLLRRGKYDAVIVAWWVWVWALPYLTMLAFLPRTTRVILQCHNIGDKEPAAWKRWLTNRVLRRGDALVVHARTEAEDAARRVWGEMQNAKCKMQNGEAVDGAPFSILHFAFCILHSPSIVKTFLPVHELGGAIPTRDEARRRLGLPGNVALFFGHVRPFKGLDIALRAWPMLQSDVTLLVAGEAWWKGEAQYRELARGLENVRFDFRFIPDSEIATYFAACDVVLAPYRIEAQSGVALTAFHFARPVIATTVGGLPEIIEEGENGLLVPPEDPAALAKAVDAFFARDDRERLERRAADSARKYSWKEYGALFRRLVAGE
ncbi:MAG TPA: glycosyltransferase family 4 protein [Thermoanaerobaculia bacterium]|nr:glycosyltransferase family 4 protein [Thermoanaerobaculia bacterium]